jgi:hypothetical protein
MLSSVSLLYMGFTIEFDQIHVLSYLSSIKSDNCMELKPETHQYISFTSRNANSKCTIPYVVNHMDEFTVNITSQEIIHIHWMDQLWEESIVIVNQEGIGNVIFTELGLSEYLKSNIISFYESGLREEEERWCTKFRLNVTAAYFHLHLLGHYGIAEITYNVNLNRCGSDYGFFGTHFIHRPVMIKEELNGHVSGMLSIRCPIYNITLIEDVKPGIYRCDELIEMVVPRLITFLSFVSLISVIINIMSCVIKLRIFQEGNSLVNKSIDESVAFQERGGLTNNMSDESSIISES